MKLPEKATSRDQPANKVESARSARKWTRPTWSAWTALILDKELVRNAKDLRIVFTPLHGTGGVIIKPMLERLGFNFEVVEEQDRFDGNFPTVESPNPENAAALRLGVELAKRSSADLVLATDPDCDRMGVAVRDGAGPEPDGQMKLLTGNQIGSLMAFYRTKTLFERGILNDDERFARGDHQDLCHHRSAKGHRGKVRPALRGDAHRLQVHRREAAQI